MKIAITGAGGFIGQHVVSEALKQGHQVCAIVRKNKHPAWLENADISVNEVDLLRDKNLAEVIGDCDALIHLAAIMSGPTQYTDTIESTKNVLAAMDSARVKMLIGFSSISILNYSLTAPMSEIDENIPLARNDAALGPYAKMKRDQEDLFLHWQNKRKHLIILRPGLVYSKNRLSSAHAGFKFLAAEHSGDVPLVHVESVATAAIASLKTIASLKESTQHQVFHVVNDNPPNQQQYLSRLKEDKKIGSTIPLPWQLYSLLMALIRLPLQIFDKTPDSMRSNSVAARQKPFKFSNRRAKQYLNWHPHQGLQA